MKVAPRKTKKWKSSGRHRTFSEKRNRQDRFEMDEVNYQWKR